MSFLACFVLLKVRQTHWKRERLRNHSLDIYLQLFRPIAFKSIPFALSAHLKNPIFEIFPKKITFFAIYGKSNQYEKMKYAKFDSSSIFKSGNMQL